MVLLILLLPVSLGVRLGSLFEIFLVSYILDCCAFIFICLQVFFDLPLDFFSKPLVFLVAYCLVAKCLFVCLFLQFFFLTVDF